MTIRLTALLKLSVHFQSIQTAEIKKEQKSIQKKEGAEKDFRDGLFEPGGRLTALQ